ncbi:MAG: stealth family protein [Acidimicrobiia bacterium]|nr:stealth family protein [Acidimicrobiia bacterium]
MRLAPKPVKAMMVRRRERIVRSLRESGRIEAALGLRLRLQVWSGRSLALLSGPVRIRLQARVPEGSRLFPVWHRRHWWLANPDERLVVAEVMRANLDLTAGLLEAAGVRYFPVPIASVNRYRLCVAEADRRRATEALAALGDPGVYVYLDDRRLAGRRVSTVRTGFRARRGLRQAEVWRVYRNYADPGGRTVLGDLHGCEIEFWAEERLDGGRPHLIATRWNKKVSSVAIDDPLKERVTVAGRSLPSVKERVHARFFDEVEFPVDLVYTWVDGSDPAWRDRKNGVLRELDLPALNVNAHNEARFKSRDELKYSLRSVAAFADFVNHVWIVTDDQIPAWLDLANPRVTVVDHKEIFGDSGRLPTFNSHAIEARLHHIEGLAEHYVYLNDDMFFGRRIVPETFFLSNGLSLFFPSTALMGLGPASKDVEPVDAAAKNGRDLVHGRFGCVVSQKFRHAPYAQRRSVLLEMEEEFSEQFERTAAAQLRSPTDLAVASSFYHYYAYLTGRAVRGTITSSYVDLGAPGLDRVLYALTQRRDFDVCCLNDTVTDPERAEIEQRLVEEFFDRYFPVKSEFELREP